jgi:2-polyprenyl-3-methyl-5-hydroxy-6-metoxy-1,4-benzoquinol methylase
MATYELNKVCERCSKKIPDDFINPLCWDCYDLLTNQKVETPQEQPVVPPTPPTAKNGITEETYIERPEAEDKEQWKANIRLFEKHKKMLWNPTRNMYTFIKTYNLNKITQHVQYPKFIWKPKIVDVGCGCGVGSNVLSQEADFVWGIDKNEDSIRFAKECFERIKNQIYYLAQVTFDVIDIMKDTRQMAQFDQVVAIEIIEHIADYKGFLNSIIRFEKKGKNGEPPAVDPTEYFISTPNRNNKYISNNGPRNRYHVREWTSGEFHNVLNEFFQNITFFDSSGKEIPIGEYATTEHSPILAKCSGVR